MVWVRKIKIRIIRKKNKMKRKIMEEEREEEGGRSDRGKRRR